MRVVSVGVLPQSDDVLGRVGAQGVDLRRESGPRRLRNSMTAGASWRRDTSEHAEEACGLH